MTLQTIPISEHPSNLDPTARLVAEDYRGIRWSIYSVRGGYVLITQGRAAVGLFPTEKAAREAVEARQS